jgi:ankyrin repeat protein
MARAKRKTLPKDFELLLEKGTVAELKAVFDVCEIDARGGYSKQTALAFDKCPNDLARWLVAQGADLSATDTWGNTPLHSRARSRRSSMAVLLELGGDVNRASSSVGTPLHAAADSHNATNARCCFSMAPALMNVIKNK